MEEAWGRILTEKTLDWILMEETLIGFRVRRDFRRRILAESDAYQRKRRIFKFDKSSQYNKVKQ
jgi:hypothetical protein